MRCQAGKHRSRPLLAELVIGKPRCRRERTQSQARHQKGMSREYRYGAKKVRGEGEPVFRNFTEQSLSSHAILAELVCRSVDSALEYHSRSIVERVRER